MRIISVELKNFCQHEDKLVTFSPGLNAIVGPNGAGKSNILGAIGFCLTGIIPTAGVKADNIRQQAPKTARSYVRLVFVHGDANIVVQRNLRPKTPNAVMTINGGEEIVGESAVDTEIERLLGVPQDVITNMVVVGHGELFGFLQQTQGARLEQFQKLFRLERAAQLYDGIGKYLTTVAVPVITESVADLQVQLATEQAEVVALETRLQGELMDPMAAQAAIDECRRQLQAAEYAKSLLTTFESGGLMLTQLRSTQLQDVANHRLKEGKYAEVDAAAEDYAAAAAAIAGWNAYKTATAAVEAARKRADDAERDMVAIQSSMPTASTQLLSKEDIAAQRVRLVQMQSRISSLQLTAGLHDGGDCPTCGTPAVAIAARCDAAKLELAELSAMQSQILSLVQYSESYYSDLEQWEKQCAAAVVQAATAAAAVNALPPITVVASCEDAVATINRGQARQTVLNQLAAEIRSGAAVIASREGQIQQLTTQLATQSVQLATMQQHTETELLGLTADLGIWQSVLRTIRECEVKLATLKERAQSTQRQIARLEVSKRQVENATAFRSLLERVRGVFHKEAAPALVIQSNLHRLQSEINRQLGFFDADYRVQVADGASFTAMFEGGIVQPVQRLSYGQKVALAFAFRLALNRTIIPQVNGLYLDEPTAFLDSRRISAFAPVFDQLRQSAQATGLQCVIVTHERQLSHLFDNVIEV